MSAAEAGDCRRSALDKLQALAPDGFAIYQQIKDRAFFASWIDCDNVPLGLSTAVHESVHYITAETDAFPLVDGGQVQRPHEVSGFFPPSRLARQFKTSDFVSTYLRPGRASSSSDFLYLLDELNAYSHDLHASVALKSLRSGDDDVDNRDGLAALMAFVALYAQAAEDSDPATWSGLQTPQVARTVAKLWDQAEAVMASSCGIPHFGMEDKTFIRQVCQSKVQSSLEPMLGRRPVCPKACLTPSPDEEAAGDTPVDTTGSDTVRRTSSVRLSTARIFMNGGAGRRMPPRRDAEADESRTQP